MSKQVWEIKMRRPKGDPQKAVPQGVIGELCSATNLAQPLLKVDLVKKEIRRK